MSVRLAQLRSYVSTSTGSQLRVGTYLAYCSTPLASSKDAFPCPGTPMRRISTGHRVARAETDSGR
eukprot:3649868-Rhodomonas_salina.3